MIALAFVLQPRAVVRGWRRGRVRQAVRARGYGWVTARVSVADMNELARYVRIARQELGGSAITASYVWRRLSIAGDQ